MKKNRIKKPRGCIVPHLDGVVGVGDEGDEEAEDHIDEERDKGVEIDPAEHPHQLALLLHVLEGGVHVVAIDQGEQALGHRVQRPKLKTENKNKVMS